MATSAIAKPDVRPSPALALHDPRKWARIGFVFEATVAVELEFLEDVVRLGRCMQGSKWLWSWSVMIGFLRGIDRAVTAFMATKAAGPRSGQAAGSMKRVTS